MLLAKNSNYFFNKVFF